MRGKMLPVLLVVAVGALVIGGSRHGRRAPRGGEDHDHDIPESDGFTATSRAEDPEVANNRKIKVAKASNGDVIGSDIAQPNNDGVQWNIGDPAQERQVLRIRQGNSGLQGRPERAVKMTNP